eukprot:6190305-Pleurochrysis_carterae.AAC.3
MTKCGFGARSGQFNCALRSLNAALYRASGLAPKGTVWVLRRTRASSVRGPFARPRGRGAKPHGLSAALRLRTAALTAELSGVAASANRTEVLLQLDGRVVNLRNRSQSAGPEIEASDWC